jgi:hypothetical protein
LRKERERERENRGKGYCLSVFWDCPVFLCVLVLEALCFGGRVWIGTSKNYGLCVWVSVFCFLCPRFSEQRQRFRTFHDFGFCGYGSFVPFNASASRLLIDNTQTSPGGENLYTLGSATKRWSTVYAGTGTINTSDEREKTFLDIEQAESDCAKALKGMMRKFKFNDSIEDKGEDARIHYGVGAQSVITKMEEFGLDPMEYAFICYDEWEEVLGQLDKDGNIITEYVPAGNRYGIRYEELLCFIISAL